MTIFNSWHLHWTHFKMYYSNGKINLFASDLQNFLACKRITYLDHEVAKGKLQKPEFNSPSAAILQQLGNEHEENYIQYLEGEGLQVLRLEKKEDSKKAHDETIAAMKSGYDIIAQPRMNLGNWGGYADILVKRDGKSELGDYYYEVQDTKLSQTTKAATILQLSLYTEMVNAIQGPYAKVIGVIKPGNPFEKEEFKIAEFDAYHRFIKKQFESAIEAGIEETYPLPVEKCGICPWWKACRGKWLSDDHLTLVAGLQRSHTKTLNDFGIKTVTDFAQAPQSVPEKPKTGSLETYDKLHGQAKVQVEGRSTNNYFELRPQWFKKTEEITENKGLNKLPVPNEGDIYFDFEGDHFYLDGGLEYLFGYTQYDPARRTHEYNKLWALNRAEEKEAFEWFMKVLGNLEDKYPEFHIYHFAPYEPSALARLASRHSIYEVEVDDLLRKKKFVDLHRVIKESMQMAVEQYSLKDLESFAGFNRTLDLQTASEARRKLGASLNLDMLDRITDEDQMVIEAYNKDDCMATLKLHQWLEEVYQKNKSSLDLQRPYAKLDEVSESVRDREQRATDLYHALAEKLPQDQESGEYKAMWLLLNCISYFRREERMTWFEYFRLKKLEDHELEKEKNAIAFLHFQDRRIDDKGKQIIQYAFDKQETSGDFAKHNKRVEETAEVSGEDKSALFTGTVVGFDPHEGTIDIRTEHQHYQRTFSIQLNNQIPQTSLENGLHSYVSNVIKEGFNINGRYCAIHDLLLRRSPRLKKDRTLASLSIGNRSLKEYALTIVLDLDHSILPIQGPPGTGKTHLGGDLILELLRQGKKVGVTAVGHKTIQNLILKTKMLGVKERLSIHAVHFKPTGLEEDESYKKVTTEKQVQKALDSGALVGGTSFFWVKPSMEHTLDYLFIDEAGQMSLNQVIAAAKSARNLVLLGDPQQLEQPQQGAHPENSDISGLEHLLDGANTIAPEKGIFLDTTWRLPESISQFTSTLYYEGKLRSHADTSQQRLTGSELFPKPGLYYVPVAHEGNQNKSEEEIEVIAGIVKQLLNDKCQWTDREGKISPLTHNHFRIIAPYNVQVNALKERLPDIQIGTVDKFQGQEAPVVIYSLASSSSEEAPRGMGFLYDPHRMNVATSRAQGLCILVANEKLFEPECHSIDQMRMANGMCRYREMSTRVELI